MTDWLLEPLQFAFFQRALVAAVLAGVTCALVGSYVVLKGLAFIGDAIAHAAFPGVVAAFVVGAPYVIGGGLAAFFSAIAIGWVSRRGRLRVDTAIGVVFVGAFALGILMFSRIEGFVGELFGFLLGNVLAISAETLVSLLLLGGLVIAIVLLLWKELLYATFDPLGAAAAGLPVSKLDYLFLGLIAVTIVVSLQAVGIILVVAMLVTPAATAQLLTVRFSRLVPGATAIGAATAVGGLYLSYWLDAPSGATIVLLQTAVFLAVLLLNPRTGLFARRNASDAASA
ncbi:MAG TPA: metal ABC transporter permease [Candidatus Limnocylindrales bacterium]|nr:metal ABC transporter permease [Candidatus Limnocylindrales bacterium]